MVEWIEEPGTVGQRTSASAITNAATTRAVAPVRFVAPTPVSFRAPAAPQVYAPGVINTVTWQWQVNNFSSSGNVTLGAYEDPKLAACEWVKDNFPPGLSLTVDGWFINAEGHWEKAFTFVTDPSFWSLDCETWFATHTLSGALGQAPTTNWTGVPEPPFWAATGLPWPPTGQLPANPPPGWYLIANSPPPIGWAGPWPPSWPPTAADVPGWPAGWPFPLPAAPAAAPPSAVPPGQVQPPAQTAKKSSGSGAGVAVAVGLAALVIVAIVAAGSG